MTTSRLRGSAAPYEPTVEQLERAKALRRFNRWAIYLPVVGASLIVLVLLGLLVGTAVIGEEARPLASALADLLTILAIIPLLVLCALLPGIAIYIRVESRRRAITPIRTLQLLLWRLERIIAKVRGSIRRAAPGIVAPVITFHMRLAQLESLLTELFTPPSAGSRLNERPHATELEE